MANVHDPRQEDKSCTTLQTPNPTCPVSRAAVLYCVVTLTSSGLQQCFQFSQMFQKSVSIKASPSGML